MNADVTLVMEGIRKRFGALAVLQDVHLAVRRARVAAILGPNGAGKTTLMKILLGLTRADAGTVKIDGQLVGDDPAVRATIGYMPQIARYPENLTGAELIAMVADLRGGAAPLDRALVERFQLGGELGKPLRTLSGGTRQKVNAVLAFLFAPTMLVLDEPTAGLDPLSSGILKDKIREERERGRTIILTSHIMTELEELADDVVVVLDGSIRFAGTVHELKLRTRQRNLERAVAQIMRGDVAAA